MIRWLFAITGIVLGIPAGLIIGGVPVAMIFVAANKTLSPPTVDDYIGLSLVLRLAVMLILVVVVLAGGAVGGRLGYKLGARL
jgi:hypothetical protein